MFKLCFQGPISAVKEMPRILKNSISYPPAHNQQMDLPEVKTGKEVYDCIANT